VKIIIVGASKVGSLLAGMMAGNHEVTVIDANAESFHRLGKDFPGRLVHGTGIDEGVLEEAGIKEADALVAVTNNINANLVITQIARVIYKVPRVSTMLPYDEATMAPYQDHWEHFARKLGIKMVNLPRLAARAFEKCVGGEVAEKCI